MNQPKRKTWSFAETTELVEQWNSDKPFKDVVDEMKPRSSSSIRTKIAQLQDQGIELRERKSIGHGEHWKGVNVFSLYKRIKSLEERVTQLEAFITSSES